jgi:hypothetical protein
MKTNEFIIASGIIIKAVRATIADVEQIVITVVNCKDLLTDQVIAKSLTMYVKENVFGKLTGFQFDAAMAAAMFKRETVFNYSRVEAGADYIRYEGSVDVFKNEKVNDQGQLIPMDIVTFTSLDIKPEMFNMLKKYVAPIEVIHEFAPLGDDNDLEDDAPEDTVDQDLPVKKAANPVRQRRAAAAV